MALIELTGIHKTYLLGTQEVAAVTDVSLSIEGAEFVSIVGPSGCGKSTLLNVIGCVDHPTRGTVKIAGVEVLKISDDALSEFRSASLGFIFQRFNLLPVLSALENVEYPLLLNRVPAEEARQRARSMLESFGMQGILHHWPSQLSGGQQQRVAIARALVTNPKIVLADEPTANLDQKTGKEILGLMRKMNEERGATFVFSTHDPQVVSYAKRVVEIRDGRITGERLTGVDQHVSA